jgi:hypothetical protein
MINFQSIVMFSRPCCSQTMIYIFFLPPRPQYRKKLSYSSELSVGKSDISIKRSGSVSGPSEARGFLVPNLAPSRSVRETIQEVKMLQVDRFYNNISIHYSCYVGETPTSYRTLSMIMMISTFLQIFLPNDKVSFNNLKT